MRRPWPSWRCVGARRASRQVVSIALGHLDPRAPCDKIAYVEPRVVFMGTPEFAIPTLEKLVERYRVVGVVTQPDRPAGRGRRLVASPVKEFAVAEGIPVLQP